MTNMNVLELFSIYDEKAQAYLAPFFASNRALAFRTCERACANPQSQFANSPSDFVLYRIGSFDQITGELTPLKHHDNLGNFVQFLPEPSATTAA